MGRKGTESRINQEVHTKKKGTHAMEAQVFRQVAPPGESDKLGDHLVVSHRLHWQQTHEKHWHLGANLHRKNKGLVERRGGASALRGLLLHQ